MPGDFVAMTELQLWWDEMGVSEHASFADWEKHYGKKNKFRGDCLAIGGAFV